jgi:hypothetical protein
MPFLGRKLTQAEQLERRGTGLDGLDNTGIPREPSTEEQSRLRRLEQLGPERLAEFRRRSARRRADNAPNSPQGIPLSGNVVQQR